MAEVAEPVFRKYLREKLSSLKSQYHDITNKYPEAASVVQQVYIVLSDNEILAKCTQAKVGEGSEWTSIVSSAEKNRANFCKILNGKPLFSALYGTYTLTLNELKAVLKVKAQAGKCGAVTKTSLELAAHDDDFQKVKRDKRHISNDTSQTAEKSTISAPKSAADKLLTKTVITRNFFAPLRTNDKDTESTETENTLPEKEAPRKSGRPPPIVMTSTTNLTRLQSDLKGYVKGEYEFQNTRNGTRIITKEITDYSAMKSYLEKNNLQYFTFPPNSEKPIKAVIRHLPPNTPEEFISNSLEGLGFSVINVRQLTANRRAPNGQLHF
jgi:hypothetical protein